MSEHDINKAINESIANVETENTYHSEEEVNEIRESLLENKQSKHVLEKLLKLHKRNIKGGSNEK